MRFIVIISLLFCTNISSAQLRYDVSVKNDTVYNNGIPQFTIKKFDKPLGKVYLFNDLNNVTQTTISFITRDLNVYCFAHFPKLLLKYETLYPMIDINVLIESFVRNKVIVNGIANPAGLTYYCKDRNIPLMPIIKVESPVNDSLSAQNALKDIASQIKFKVTNKKNLAVKLFIGSKASNRTRIVGPGMSINDHARAGERICIIDEEGNPISCTIIDASISQLVINAEGTRLE
jgi:hypothetical protein